MQIGAAMFFTDYSMAPTELGRALEERGFESLWAPEHSHIPLSRKSPFPSGGELPKQYYDAMDPFVMLSVAAGGHEEAQTRHRRLPRHPARHDPDREGGGVARPGLGRAVSVRDRWRVEPGRNGGPRRGLCDALQEDARADRGDARDLDQIEARISRRDGRLSADDDLAEAGAEPAAGYRRRRLSACRTPRGALRQRLGPDRRTRAVWRHRRLPAEVQGDAERGR